MSDENQYIAGPPPGYDPPPIDSLRDPEHHTRTRKRGRELVLQVLAESIGLRKQADGTWTRETDNEGEQ